MANSIIKHIGTIPNYQQITQYTSPFTAPKDGWCVIQGNTTSNNTISVNNDVLFYDDKNYFGTSQIRVCRMFPVKKGDVITSDKITTISFMLNR